MSMFRKDDKKKMPGITSGSLSDIVFMLLFFFMISTSFRQTDKLVQVKLPAATENTKLERKDLTSYIYVGAPIPSKQAQYGTDSRIQLNDSYKTVNEIRDFIAAERESISEGEREAMTVALKADENVRMGIITDIKQELRRCSALKILYVARQREAN